MCVMSARTRFRSLLKEIHVTSALDTQANRSRLPNLSRMIPQRRSSLQVKSAAATLPSTNLIVSARSVRRCQTNSSQAPQTLTKPAFFRRSATRRINFWTRSCCSSFCFSSRKTARHRSKASTILPLDNLFRTCSARARNLFRSPTKWSQASKAEKAHLFNMRRRMRSRSLCWRSRSRASNRSAVAAARHCDNAGTSLPFINRARTCRMRRLNLFRSCAFSRQEFSAFAAETRRMRFTNLAQMASWRSASFSASSAASTNADHVLNDEPVNPCNN
mmetsp:Transcript_22978/g.59763  ORF Transcript_22978/g.59763 Transcript_22978/m.59763 type:complete len:275 (+) Transcript_22978:2479-3303(+)